MKNSRAPFGLLKVSQKGLAAGVVMACLSAHAQYKVVGPDGKVTYTDRPVANLPAGGQIQNLRGASATRAGSSGDSAGLPIELRQVATRFPVILYTGSDCPPCDSGRKLLQQRGIPFREREVTSDEDVSVLQRLTGGKTVPALTVGSQALKGYLATDWSNTLDLAGYPSESRLPRNYLAPQPTPLTSHNQPEPAVPVVSSSEPSVPAVPQPGVGKIRF